MKTESSLNFLDGVRDVSSKSLTESKIWVKYSSGYFVRASKSAIHQTDNNVNYAFRSTCSRITPLRTKKFLSKN